MELAQHDASELPMMTPASAGTPPVIGVVGGVASGKSFVANQLKAKGARVISADELAHEVLKMDEVKALARERWGEGVFDDSGQIDRRAVGEIVFAPDAGGASELKVLEQWVHPRVRAMIGRQVDEIRRSGTATAIVLDVPLLVEAGWDRQCDHVLYVEVPRELRLARAKARGWTEEDFDRREASQRPLIEKRGAASWQIDNSGSAESLRQQIEHFWDSLNRPSLPK